jgi:hypothetical protein
MLTHLEVVAESPLPHELPEGMDYHYRILSYNEQGNCVGGCKPSTILITIWNYTDYLDGNIQLFRIDGMRFWRFIGIEEFKGDQPRGYFLAFRFQSRYDPGEPQDYRVKIGWDFASIERL